MYKLEIAESVENLVSITKSDSGVSGPELCKAQMELGTLLGKEMDIDSEDTTVVAILRGGIFFAEGIYFALGCKFEVYDPKTGPFKKPITSNIILVDSVINTGETIKEIYEPGMKVACCVINEKVVDDFYDCLYTVRVSSNSFVGSNVKKQSGNMGPDTTMRLFNQL